MSLSATTFKLHRWLGWLVGIQVLVWVLGGVVFSLLPFQAWVKAADTVRPPSVVLPAGWVERLAPVLQAAAAQGEVVAVAAVATPRGPALRLGYREGREPLLLPADGSAWVAPDEAALRQFGASLYRGTGVLVALERVQTPPRRLGIVEETGGRSDLWRLQFDDALRTPSTSMAAAASTSPPAPKPGSGTTSSGACTSWITAAAKTSTARCCAPRR